MGDLGARLKEARQSKGVSLREIASQTKIAVAALEALERAEYSRLPGGIFSRAFVRAYATAVDLDPEIAVNDFLVEYARYQQDAERSAKRPEITPDDLVFLERQKKALRTLRLILLGAAIVAIAALAYGVFIWWPATGRSAPVAPASSAARPDGPLRPHLGESIHVDGGSAPFVL
jgi:cytoskeletal protein RodZ